MKLQKCIGECCAITLIIVSTAAILTAMTFISKTDFSVTCSLKIYCGSRDSTSKKKKLYFSNLFCVIFYFIKSSLLFST